MAGYQAAPRGVSRRIVVFLASAEEDVRSAFAYYEACSDGLGSGFVEELNTAVDYLEEHSEPGPAYDADIRRILLRRFPYGVFYTIEKERIVVHAILDLRMNPSGMRERFN